jgi:hypothetical protein
VNARPQTSGRAADSVSAGPILGESFVAQECRGGPYLYLCCRHCKLTWFLPRDATRRTADAMSILAAHAASHRRAPAEQERAHGGAP